MAAGEVLTDLRSRGRLAPDRVAGPPVKEAFKNFPKGFQLAIATKKTAAIALAAGLAVSGSAGSMLAPAAFAQENAAESAAASASQAAPSASAGVDNAKQLSLTLHKKKLSNGATEGPQATGETMQNVPGEGLAGVSYRLDMIQSLNSDKDWQEAAKIWQRTQDGASVGSLNGTEAATGTTGANGDVTFGNLKKGLYRVVETEAPEGVVPGAPFLVYVPMTNAEGNGWIYDVHAYPKNTEDTVKKEVKDEWVNAGQDYTYTLTTGVPSGKLTKFIVRDDLDRQLAQPQASDVKVEAPGIDAGDYDVVIDGQRVEVVFTTEGMKKLRAGTNVVTTITAKTNGPVQHVPNQGTLIYNNGSSENDVEKPTNKTHSYWGNLKVTKVSDQGTNLAGADFELVRCEVSAGTAGGGQTWTEVGNAGAQSAYVGNEQTKTFTTGEDGTVTISGIHVDDFENNDGSDAQTNFCLRETKAPAGYVANEQLIPFELQRGDVDESGEPSVPIQAAAEVINFKSPNTLPNTGGMGVTILALAGLTIVGGGIYAARRNSKAA